MAIMLPCFFLNMYIYTFFRITFSGVHLKNTMWFSNLLGFFYAKNIEWRQNMSREKTDASYAVLSRRVTGSIHVNSIITSFLGNNEVTYLEMLTDLLSYYFRDCVCTEITVTFFFYFRFFFFFFWLKKKETPNKQRYFGETMYMQWKLK